LRVVTETQETTNKCNAAIWI